MNILLAEDGELNQQLVSRMIHKMGHSCDIAGDGRAALDAVRAGRYDAVLMDGEMPVMDGREATRGIRELERAEGRPRTVVIALTGGASQEDIDACLAAGMDDHLAKPISYKLLEEKLRKHDARPDGARAASPAATGPASPAKSAAAAIHAAPTGGEKNMREEIVKDIVSGLNLPPAIAQKLLNEYLKTLPGDVAKLKEAIDGGDYPAAAKLAHSIKGASGNLRVNKIFQLAGDLEQTLKGADGAAPQEQAAAMFGELQGVVSQLA